MLNTDSVCTTCQGYCTYDQADLTSILETANDTLFEQILTYPNRILASLLPEKIDAHYQLKPSIHNRQVIPKINKMYSFFTRVMLC